MRRVTIAMPQKKIMGTYRAIISNIGKSAHAPELVHLRRSLVQQFTHSPFCSRILIQRSEEDLSVEVLLREIPGKSDGFTSTKDIYIPDIHPNDLVVQLPFSTPIEFDGECMKRITSWNIVQPIRTSFPNSSQAVIIQNLTGLAPHVRITAFRYGRLCLSNQISKDAYNGSLSSKRIADLFYSIYSDFLPVKYRAILTENLAQAIRLNYETCIADNLASEKIEDLNFEHFMRIIGLEDRI